MKCHICGEREATVHYIEIIEGKKTSQWLCHECADREGITPSDTVSLAHGGLESFLGEMLKFGPVERERARPATGSVCPACGYEYRRLQESGMLGCPDCYRAFHPQLLPMLRRFHGDTTYLGKLPRSHGAQAAARREIAQLKGLLEQAVAMEASTCITVGSLPPSLLMGAGDRGVHSLGMVLPTEGLDIEAHLDTIRRELMRQALERCRGVQKDAARLLRMTYRAFRYHAEKFNLTAED